MPMDCHGLVTRLSRFRGLVRRNPVQGIPNNRGRQSEGLYQAQAMTQVAPSLPETSAILPRLNTKPWGYFISCAVFGVMHFSDSF